MIHISDLSMYTHAVRKVYYKMHKSLILQWFLSGAAFAAAPGFVNLDLVSSLGSTGGAQNKDVVATVKSGDELLLTELQIGSNKDSVLVAIDTGSEYLWVMDSDVTCESKPSKRNVFGKRDAVDISLKDKQTQMLTELRIGSNRDKVQVNVDTGSSILWVMSSNVTCAESPLTNKAPKCKAHGTFSYQKSESFNNKKKMFNATYADKESAIGVYSTDDIIIGKDVAVKGFEFGLAVWASSEVGILGIGFPEANSTGRSLPFELSNQGITNRSAYSIFLNKPNKPGSILFGAVDHSKYLGDLQTVPIVYNKTFPEIKVNVSGIDININGTKVSGGISESAFVLDTGTAKSRFPNSVLDTLREQIEGSEYLESEFLFGSPNCSQIENLKIEIKFDGKTITVPVKDLGFDRDGDGCTFDIMFNDDELILGMDVLRSIYFVVDLDDKEVSLAQSDFSNGKQDIEAFPPPGVNRTLASRGRSEQKVSSANSIVSSIDTLLCLAILLTWSL
ncbi:uncharacterized protein SPAPADRAFT_156595 [Spathaspora passalidarum NRRL Y-27907]|uniref:candidapepsin n=1 Tax=Spathaspora passalidarum (strain NRRL Y-27907 / 11-Y1) TaxID=619300 RepID=G3AS54_SPAPN|nr:uncharacterized protein SPAPADRAFT_156595 [Spathaspora passalidarum NRRL Y-27907]EGW31013.1 hypothetical protein SPAPADRAFT_156595 [Spathaspora passalidarum NRRL Y-27907]